MQRLLIAAILVLAVTAHFDEVEESGRFGDFVKQGIQKVAPHVKDIARQVAPVAKEAWINKIKGEIMKKLQFSEEEIDESGRLGDLVKKGVQKLAPHVKDIAREVAPIAKEALINKIKSEISNKLRFLEEEDVEESGRFGDLIKKGIEKAAPHVKDIARQVAPIAKEALINKIKSEINNKMRFTEEETEESGLGDLIKKGAQKLAPHVKDLAREVAPIAKEALVNKIKSEINNKMRFLEEEDVEESGRVGDLVKKGIQKVAPHVKDIAREVAPALKQAVINKLKEEISKRLQLEEIEESGFRDFIRKGPQALVPHVQDIARQIAPVAKEALMNKIKSEIMKKLKFFEEDLEESGRFGDLLKKGIQKAAPHVKDLAREVAPIAKEALVNKIKSEINNKMRFIEEEDVEESGRFGDLVKKGIQKAAPHVKDIVREVAPIAKEALMNKIKSEISNRLKFEEEAEESQYYPYRNYSRTYQHYNPWSRLNQRVPNESHWGLPRWNTRRYQFVEEVEESQLGRRVSADYFKNKTNDKYGRLDRPYWKKNMKDNKKGQQEGKGWWNRYMPGWFRSGPKNNNRTRTGLWNKTRTGGWNKPMKPTRPMMPRRPRWNFTNF